jgi:hypothetical protein
MHLPREDGDGDGKPEAVAPSAWVAALISGVLGNQLPGPGTLYLSQDLKFPGRAHAGDTLTVTVRVEEKGPEGEVLLSARVEGPAGPVCTGTVRVLAPDHAVSVDASGVPGLTVQSHANFERLLERAEPFRPCPPSSSAPKARTP